MGVREEGAEGGGVVWEGVGGEGGGRGGGGGGEEGGGGGGGEGEDALRTRGG